MPSIAPVVLAVSSENQTELSDADARIRAIINPPAACPVCWIEEHHYPPPSTHTTRICPTHAAEMWARSETHKSHQEVRQ